MVRVHHFVLFDSEDAHRWNGTWGALIAEGAVLSERNLVIGVKGFDAAFFFAKTLKPHLPVRMVRIKSGEEGMQAFTYKTAGANVVGGCQTIKRRPAVTRENETLCTEILPPSGKVGERDAPVLMLLIDVRFIAESIGTIGEARKKALMILPVFVECNF
jgi:hypothetical protein